jgi:hypothetical protein
MQPRFATGVLAGIVRVARDGSVACTTSGTIAASYSMRRGYAAQPQTNKGKRHLETAMYGVRVNRCHGLQAMHVSMLMSAYSLAPLHSCYRRSSIFSEMPWCAGCSSHWHGRLVLRCSAAIPHVLCGTCIEASCTVLVPAVVLTDETCTAAKDYALVPMFRCLCRQQGTRGQFVLARCAWLSWVCTGTCCHAWAGCRLQSVCLTHSCQPLQRVEDKIKQREQNPNEDLERCDCASLFFAPGQQLLCDDSGSSALPTKLVSIGTTPWGNPDLCHCTLPAGPAGA